MTEPAIAPCGAGDLDDVIDLVNLGYRSASTLARSHWRDPALSP